MNVDMLMHTRSDDASIRICALQCAAYVWSSDGLRLAGWKPETMAFLHECAEDENEDVVTEARKLKQILDKY
jgi:U3 small nucleolar RNA-associated protein 10